MSPSDEISPANETARHDAQKRDRASAPQTLAAGNKPLKLVMIAGEHSGDLLGGKLMQAILEQTNGAVRFAGLGGDTMTAQGLVSPFPMDEVAVMGLGAIARRLPQLIKRVHQCVDAAVAFEPDAVVIIDAPEFTHPIAKRIKKRLPHIPIVDYVSPSVWAWRPGRARKMTAYIDHVLALLPFEPAVHERLGGPACSYVGHPLLEKAPWIASLDQAPLARRLGLAGDRPVLVVLPGSRSSEIVRLMEPFGKTIELLARQGHDLEVIIPALASKRSEIEKQVSNWPIAPHLVLGEDDKFRAFKLADVALAASGTVTLELAVAGTPMVVGYRVDALTYQVLRAMATARSAVLANLVLDENAFPEFLHDTCYADHLAPAVAALIGDTFERRAQIAALAKIHPAMAVTGGTPSAIAAKIVLRHVRASSRRA